MFALTGPEIAFVVLTLVGIAAALVVLAKSGDFRTGLVVVIGAVVLPVIGPLFALGYGAILLVRSRQANLRKGPSA